VRKIKSNEHTSLESFNRKVFDYLPQITGSTKQISIQNNVSFVEKESSTIKTSCKLKNNIRRLSTNKEAVPTFKDKFLTNENSFMCFSKLDIKVIETWLDNVLKEIETTIIPKQFWDDSMKNSLKRFGIDRKKLQVVYNNFIALWNG